MQSFTSRFMLLLAGGALTAALPRASAAQADAAPTAPAVGQMAPDFALPGATRYGRLAEPVRLSDFRGKTVVIAFFFKARTKG
jgi:cytochrome oxidase Cu insertion factor (SCO1/SenC/PrrC family)